MVSIWKKASTVNYEIMSLCVPFEEKSIFSLIYLCFFGKITCSKLEVLLWQTLNNKLSVL